mgnify:CR=1 FL=1
MVSVKMVSVKRLSVNADRTSASKPQEVVEGAGLWVRGRVTGRYSTFLDISYRVGPYYIPESRSREAEQTQFSGGRRAQITVEVAVDDSGRALIRRVFVDGKPLGF